MEPSFAKNAQRLFQERTLSLSIPAGASLSLPVTVRLAGERLADAVFFYEDAADRGRPFAWALLDLVTGSCLQYADCALHDFTPRGAYPLDMPFSLRPPQPITLTQLGDGRRELAGLYESLRTFAFCAEPTREQRELMVRYARLFETLCYVAHRPFYRALAPDFLAWLGLELEGGPEPAIEADKLAPAMGGDVAAALRELSDLFVRKIETDEHKQRLFDTMHAELQEYKNNLLDTLTRPLEGDVIKLIDDIEKSMEVYRSRQFTPDNYRRLFTLFEGVATDLTDLLYRHGAEPFNQEGDEVVVGRQKILATLPTEKPKLDKKVAVRHSKGWEKNGKIIRPERISVYVYTPPGAKADR